ncbi:uncharacterized protein LOC143459832 [Clavelina lepadiformis]|uniref:uncharacterized protein LOC143459832 n=1 Tax=Clavelina lepadiformis TaxID=159417 RepID=UPI004040FBD5
MVSMKSTYFQLIVCMIVFGLISAEGSRSKHWLKWIKPGMPKHGGRRIETDVFTSYRNNYRLHRPYPINVKPRQVTPDEVTEITESNAVYKHRLSSVLTVLKDFADGKINIDLDDYLEDVKP